MISPQEREARIRREERKIEEQAKREGKPLTRSQIRRKAEAKVDYYHR